MKIISISGLDGSGKSTQIQLLKNYLESQGKRVFYFHAIQFGIANKFKSNSSSGEGKSKTQAGYAGILLRKIFLRIDTCRFKKLLKKLEKEGYNYLLTDRYFYDSAVNIAYLSNLKLNFRKFLKLSFRKPDIAIYLDADPEIIMQRERKPDQGIEYLRKKKEIFDTCAEEWGLKAINGNRPQEEVFEEIKKLI